MGNIQDEAFLGVRESYNKKLEMLANMAEPETWSFGKEKASDPYRILRNYFHFTYNRLSEENKIITSECGEYRCMNTGLLTVYTQEIVALFSKSKNSGPTMKDWHFNGFFKETDTRFTSYFSKIPEIANFSNNPSDLIFNRNLDIRIKKEHIIEDNFQRFVDIGLDSKEIIDAYLVSAITKLKKRLSRNFKLALPFYYHKTENDEKKIQLLAPLYFPNSKVELALVLNKLNSGTEEYYEGVTVLPVEWAYMNARTIVKPDEEWAKIMENIDLLNTDKL